MTHTTAVYPTLRRAMSTSLGPGVGEVEIGVRYDVDCSTEHPVSHGVQVLVKVLHDMELNRPLYYFTVQEMVVRTTGPGRRLNIMNAKYQGYDHGS